MAASRKQKIRLNSSVDVAGCRQGDAQRRGEETFGCIFSDVPRPQLHLPEMEGGDFAGVPNKLLSEALPKFACGDCFLSSLA